MSKANFLYCNKCFESNGEVKHKFFVSNCYHIFCAGCLTAVKDMCSICNKQCKLLPIDANLPKEIRIYFEPKAQEKLMQNIVKMHEFQHTQTKTYTDKHYPDRKAYFECMKKISEIESYSKQLVESIKREKAIMDKLKDALKTNVITPELFQMRSQGSSPQGIKTPDDITKSDHSSSASSAATIIHEKNCNTYEIPLSNYEKHPHMSDSQCTKPNSKENVIKEVHKIIVKDALHDLNQATQQRTQIQQSQINSNRIFKI